MIQFVHKVTVMVYPDKMVSTVYLAVYHGNDVTFLIGCTYHRTGVVTLHGNPPHEITAPGVIDEEFVQPLLS